MVFSSLPIYLDPANWTQQQHHHQQHHHQVANQIQLSAIGEPQHLSQQQQQQQLTPPPSSGTEPVTSSGPARPNSMAERARLAKVPQPELALKCPRCESTNTKFCYFNNYSLSQPRHFCKTCRRYWTRGGSLRNVPVGGGCRRNKRSSKSGNSAASSKSSASTSSTAANCAAVPPHVMNPPPPPQLSFVALQSLADYGSDPNVDGMSFPAATEYNSLSGGLDQWRFEQFPFYGGVENAHAPLPQAQLAAAGGLGFPFDVGVDGFGTQVGPRVSGSLRLSDQLASVKMEDSNPHMLNLPRQFLGIPGSNHHYWGGGGGDGNGSGSNAGWPLDISAFNSSSSGNLL